MSKGMIVIWLAWFCVLIGLVFAERITWTMLAMQPVCVAAGWGLAWLLHRRRQ